MDELDLKLQLARVLLTLRKTQLREMDAPSFRAMVRCTMKAG